jgi:transaldolase
MHWSELVGGDLILTIPCAWQRRFNGSSIPVEPRFEHPVDPLIVEQLYATFDDFRRAYEPDGMSVDQFDSFGATVRTLRSFISSYHDLLGVVRDLMLPDPDIGHRS